MKNSIIFTFLVASLSLLMVIKADQTPQKDTLNRLAVIISNRYSTLAHSKQRVFLLVTLTALSPELQTLILGSLAQDSRLKSVT